MRLRLAVLSLFALAVTACEREAQDNSPLPAVDLVSRFGCENCEGIAQFSGIQAIAVTPSGDIVVVDGSEPHIRIFDLNGEVLHAFGRSGAGPGEYVSPSGITALQDGEFLVVDLGRRRAVRVSATGEEVSSVSFGGLPASSSSNEGGRDVLVAISSPRDTALRLVRLGQDDSPEYGVFGSNYFPSRRGNWGALPFAVSPEGLVAIGEGKDAYLIQVFDPEADLVATIMRDVPRAVRTEAELQSEREAYERRLERMQAMVPGATFPAPEVPPERDYFLADALRYGPDGNLWVQVERAEPGSTTFDLYSPGRDHHGELTLPFRIINYSIGRDLLAAVVLDDLDVQNVAVWRLAPPGGQ